MMRVYNKQDQAQEILNITQVEGLTDGQKSVLQLLGAIEDKKQKLHE
jgi:hypothetical protein